MKKLLSLLFVLMLAASTAMAAEKKSSKSKDKKSVKKEEKKQSSSNNGTEKGSFVLQIQGDLTLQASNTNSYPITFMGAGFGFEIGGSYAFNENFSLGLMTGIHAFDVNNPAIYSFNGGSWSYAPTEIVAQYSFTGSTAKPYILFGLGIANTVITWDLPPAGNPNVGVASESDLIFSPGIGIAFEVSEKVNFFAQMRVDVVALSPFWSANITRDAVFIPIQLGFNFGGL